MENRLVGSMMHYPDCVADVLQEIGDDYFTSWPARIVFVAIKELWTAKRKIDLTTVAAWLTQQGRIEELASGSKSPYVFLAELWEMASIDGYGCAQALRSDHMRRRLTMIGEQMIENSVRPFGPVAEVIDQFERELFALAQLGQNGSAVDVQVAIGETCDVIDERVSKTVTGIPSGFPDLDELTAGWQGSELIIVAARPSVGKTSFGLNLMRHAALAARTPVFFASLEQTRVELVGRLLCDLGDVSTTRYRHARLSDDDHRRLAKAKETLWPAQVHIDDGSRQSMLRIVANARRLKSQKNIGLVIVDYLQLIDPDNRRESRQEQVAGISRRLKQMAREIHVPVIAMAQLNRGADEHERPRLSDIRESGAVEQDADCVIALWRRKENDPTEVGCSVLKQRNGPIGNVALRFEPQYMRFSNPSMPVI